MTLLTANLTPRSNGGVLPGSIPVRIDASTTSTPTQIAAAFTTAVVDALQTQSIPLVKVTQLGPNVLVENAVSVVGLGTKVVSGIMDRAGNPLRETDSSGSTILTIQIGGGFDYGDAPSSYGSAKVDNGHATRYSKVFQLGSGVTSDGDAQPNNTDVDDASHSRARRCRLSGRGSM